MKQNRIKRLESKLNALGFIVQISSVRDGEGTIYSFEEYNKPRFFTAMFVSHEYASKVGDDKIISEYLTTRQEAYCRERKELLGSAFLA